MLTRVNKKRFMNWWTDFIIKLWKGTPNHWRTVTNWIYLLPVAYKVDFECTLCLWALCTICLQTGACNKYIVHLQYGIFQLILGLTRLYFPYTTRGVTEGDCKLAVHDYLLLYEKCRLCSLIIFLIFKGTENQLNFTVSIHKSVKQNTLRTI